MNSIPVRILGTGRSVPSRKVTTRELLGVVLPNQPPEALETRIGIRNRYWLAEGETAAQLAALALKKALEAAEVAPAELARIVFVTSTGGDQMIPATAHNVANLLGISGTCDAFDLSDACAGFLAGLDVASRSVATGMHPVGVVAVETFSRLLSPQGRRAYLVLGDAAGAAVLGPGRPGEGIVASRMRSSELLRNRMVMGQPWSPGTRPYHDFDTRNEDIAATALTLIEEEVAAVLDRAGLALGDVRWVVPHQPNGEIVTALMQRLGVPAERFVPIYPEVGSVGAASVAFGLDRLMREQQIEPGAHILLAAVGAGTTSGAILYRVAP